MDGGWDEPDLRKILILQLRRQHQGIRSAGDVQAKHSKLPTDEQGVVCVTYGDRVELGNREHPMIIWILECGVARIEVVGIIPSKSHYAVVSRGVNRVVLGGINSDRQGVNAEGAA